MGREMVEENIDGINTLVERGHARLGR
jgi:hypothetical protein